MKKNAGKINLLWIPALFIVLAEFSAIPKVVIAAPQVVPVEGMIYNVNASIADNLKPLVGKKVYVTVASGNTLYGFVKEVGEHLVHLEKLDGKDFFDALIRLEDITAIEAKFRDYQR